VANGKLFFTSEDKENFVGLCVNSEGKEVWRVVLAKSDNKKARGDEGNGASASPSTDGKHVWFFVGTGHLSCYTVDGKEVWTKDIQKEYGKFDIQFGMHSTPILHEGKVYCQLLHTKGQWVICFAAADGKQVWKIDRKSDGRAENEHSYASPMLWSNGNKALLVTHGNDYCIGHDLADGKEVWRIAGLNPKDKYNPTLRFVASPLCTPELIVIPTAKNGAVVGIKPKADGTVDVTKGDELWRVSQGTPDVPSPLLHNGIVYLVGEQGNLTALDAKTGKAHYTKSRLHAARHRASPVYADGKIFTASRDGVVCVTKVGEKFELISSNKMNDDFTASPVIVDDRIYLRGFKNLYAIGNK
jgi:outer membrane protein assembly factor BamB